MDLCYFILITEKFPGIGPTPKDATVSSKDVIILNKTSHPTTLPEVGKKYWVWLLGMV